MKNSENYVKVVAVAMEGNLIRKDYSDGVVKWYDVYDREIICKCTDGTKICYDYDDKGKTTYKKFPTGETEFYDHKNRLIEHKKIGTLIKFSYDKNGKIVCQKKFKHDKLIQLNFPDIVIDYDDKGNMIHYKKSSGYERWCEFDNKGKLIHYKNSNGFEIWYEYDDNGNCIHSKDSKGNEIWLEYDNKGKLIHYKDSKGNEIWWEYDDTGELIHYKNSNGYEEWWGY